MVDPASPYAERLQAAMRAAGRDPGLTGSVSWLAQKLDVTYQAARKAVSGETKMLAADNSAKAAALLGVDSDWLATGKGSMERSKPQLSARALRVAAIYDSVTPKDRRHIDAAADAAASPDVPADLAVTDSDDQPPLLPKSAPARPS